MHSENSTCICGHFRGTLTKPYDFPTSTTVHVRLRIMGYGEELERANGVNVVIFEWHLQDKANVEGKDMYIA